MTILHSKISFVIRNISFNYKTPINLFTIKKQKICKVTKVFLRNWGYGTFYVISVTKIHATD